MTKWNIVQCFALPRKFSHMSVDEFVDDHLTDNTDTNILQDPAQREMIIEDIKKKVTKKEAKKANAGSKYIVTLKRDAARLLAEEEGEGEGEDEDGPVKKKTKLSGNDKAKAVAYNKFSGMKIPQLQDILSWNNVVKTGTKDVLLTRVIDGFVYGRIDKCVACKYGQPRVSDDGSAIVCPGYFNEDKGYRVPCGNSIFIESAPRLNPWYINEPTEEEEEAMKEESKASVSGSDAKLPDSMVEAAEKIEWDLSVKANIKKATSDMIQIISSEKSPIDLPSDKSKVKMEIGTLIVLNKNESALAVLNLIVEKYGFKEGNDEMAKNDEENIGAMLTVKANVSVYMAIKELSDLYFKEKNTNAGITYRKVAQAVKDLDFEITEKNAKGLGKGKTKLEGIGKGSAEKMYELLATGKIQKLEEKRAAQA